MADQSLPRFIVSPAGSPDFQYFIIVDSVSNRIVGQSFNQQDADFIGTKLNQTSAPTYAQARSNMAMELYAFRVNMEYENGGPLVGDPGIALVLADLCNFFEFNEGERALVLGRDLIVFLASMDEPHHQALYIEDRGVEHEQLVIISK